MIGSICVAIIALMLQRDIYKFRDYLDKKGVEYSPISDFYLSFVSMFAIFLFRYLIKKITYHSILEIIVDKHQGPQREKEATKMVKWIGDVLYYSIMVGVGLYIMNDKNFLPYSLMGSGECKHLFSTYPYQESDYYL